MEVIIYSPKHFKNLCVISRTLEALGIYRCYVYDPNRIVRDRYGKSYNRMLKTVSAGAFHKIKWKKIEDTIGFIRDFQYRAIAAVPNRTAKSLYNFQFSETDLLVFGSEGNGLSEDIISACSTSVTIPQAGETESLNISVASGIFLAEWLRQQSLGLLAKGNITNTCTGNRPQVDSSDV